MQDLKVLFPSVSLPYSKGGLQINAHSHLRRNAYGGKDLFKREDFDVLKDILKEVKGRFMLSINDLT